MNGCRESNLKATAALWWHFYFPYTVKLLIATTYILIKFAFPKTYNYDAYSLHLSQHTFTSGAHVFRVTKLYHKFVKRSKFFKDYMFLHVRIFNQTLCEMELGRDNKGFEI